MMLFIRKILCLLLLSTSLNAEDYKLKILFDGKSYDNVTLNANRSNGDMKKIKGLFDQNDNSWNFVIPDSLYCDIITVAFDLFYDKNENALYCVDYKSVSGQDTTVFRSSVLDRHIKQLKATYLYTSEMDGIYINKRPGRFVFDSYMIEIQKNTE